MNLLLISVLFIASVSYFPARTVSSTTTEIEEQPHALPLAAAEGTQNTAGEIWQEDDREVLIRSVRGAKNAAGSGKREKNKKNNNRKISEGKSKKTPTCRYEKGQWTDCDPQTNMRSRTLTLKKGDEGCDRTRTIEKKCKKACRYDKGEWSKCVNGTMTRTDNIRPGCDPSCKQTREVNKNCNKDKRPKKQDKNARKSRA